jgi:flagellar biosynthesis/type III secretory pathway protein FliH
VIPCDAASPTTRPTPPSRPEHDPLPKTPPTQHPPASTAPSTPVAPAPTPDRAALDAELALDRGRIEAVLGEIRTTVAGLRQDRTSRMQELQRAAVELATTIASRLLHERVVAGDFPIDAKVRDMIAQLGADVPVVVRLNPTDLDLLKSRLGGEPLTADRDDPKFVPDPALTRGACQVEGRESMLLSDVTRELEDIRTDLLRSLDNARP